MESTILHNPILLVDDEKDITDLIEEVLRQTPTMRNAVQYLIITRLFGERNNQNL